MVNGVWLIDLLISETNNYKPYTIRRIMNKSIYIRPKIKVCDYISQNSLMLKIGEGSTTDVLSKEAMSSDDWNEGSEDSSVWDD